MEVYLDNSATTRVCASAAQAALDAMTAEYGNPSSLHSKGLAAKKILDDARRAAAERLGGLPEEIFFSHSGTLANNAAVFGAVQAKRRAGNRIVTTAAEHPSVGKCMDELERQGFEVIRLKPASDGNIPAEALQEAVNEKTILVSMMLVNNETGAIFPVEQIRRAVRAANAPALIHTDAIQAFGKLPVRLSSLGVDLLTASGHKLHAPKGVGLLYVKKGVGLKPFVYGGGQENGLFSGTQPLPAVAGFGAAIREADVSTHLPAAKENMRFLRGLLEHIPAVRFNSPADASPYILNFSVEGIPSQVTINFLSAREIYVSAGSACKKGHRSEVLTAMDLPPDRIDTALRVSLSRFTTKEELTAFADALSDAVKTVRTKL